MYADRPVDPPRSGREPLCAVIVTHNRAILLESSLRHTMATDIDRIIVIDNASKDDTPAVLKRLSQEDPRLMILRQKENLGGAEGFSIGLQKADELLQGKGWVMLYDDDAYPDLDCVARFRRNSAEYQQGKLTGVAALVLSPDGRPVEVNRPILNPFRRPLQVLRITLPATRALRDLYHVPYERLTPTAPRTTIDAASFVGLFLRLEALPRNPATRYPKGCFFIYSDDTTYTLDLVHAGHRLLLDPALQFTHATASDLRGEPWMLPLWKHYYVVRNSFTMNRSLSGLFYLPLCLLTAGHHLVIAFRYLASKRSATLLHIVRVGIADGIRQRFNRPHAWVAALAEDGGR